MPARRLSLCAAILPMLMLVPALAQRNTASSVRPIFDLSSPDRGPFPSDRFTVRDRDQHTGRRVNLPMPDDCVANASDCEDVAVLNQLDGFNMQARISVPFDGGIDAASVTGNTVFLLSLGDALANREAPNPSDVRLPANPIIGINQIVWDPATGELSFRPDNSLEQHATYALVVTTGMRDAAGNRIGVAEGFRRYRNDLAHDEDRYYRQALLTAEWAVRRAFEHPVQIAALSVFTTQTFSHIVERMYDAIQAAPAPTLTFSVGPGGSRAVFDAAQIQSLTNNAHINVTGPLTAQPQNLAAMRIIPGAVGTLAFGTFRALDFTTRASGHIAPVPTRTGTLAATGSLDVAFDLWLPAGTPPPGGWPVAIYGHGSVGTKNSPIVHAAVLNSHGLAVLAINAVGRGGGPRTTMTIRLTDGATMTFAAPGLGYDQDADGTIEQWEPQRALRPHALLNTSGSLAQAAAQYFSLVRGIQEGVDVDGNGAPDLDASRIYYLGQSMGAMWGMHVFAYEPAIRAAAFNVPAGTLPYNSLLSPVTRPGWGEMLAARTPSLLNPPHGLTSVDGVAVAAPQFAENLPLRNQLPRINTIPGAIAVQRFVDRAVWAAQISSTVAVAPMLRRARPAEVPERPFVFQWARSDQIVVNPSATELIRAGEFADRVIFYRHDLNFGLPGVPANPHGFLSSIGPATPNFQRIALGAQQQVARFFQSDGLGVIHPAPAHLWEVPIRNPFPEDTFYLPR